MTGACHWILSNVSSESPKVTGVTDFCGVVPWQELLVDAAAGEEQRAEAGEEQRAEAGEEQRAEAGRNPAQTPRPPGGRPPKELSKRPEGDKGDRRVTEACHRKSP